MIRIASEYPVSRLTNRSPPPGITLWDPWSLFIVYTGAIPEQAI